MSDGETRRFHHLRHTITAAVVVFYVAPLVLLTLFNAWMLPLSQSWQILSAGFVCTFVGSAGILSLLNKWERSSFKAQPESSLPALPVSPSPEEIVSSEELEQLQQNLEEFQHKQEALAQELHRSQKNLEGAEREKEQLSHRCDEFQEQLTHRERASQEELQNKSTLLEEYQLTISEQRAVIEKKQSRILDLESRVKDLKYELKTVLDVNERMERGEEVESSSTKPAIASAEPAPRAPAAPKPAQPVESAQQPILELGLTTSSQSYDEAQVQLKRCIDIAQKLTGARHLAGDSSMFRDLSSAGYALDLRRLCDSLRSEQSSMIVLYSQRENKLLFVNNQVRGLLGWSPEKFLQHFPNLIIRGEREWRVALQRLATDERTTVSLTLKARSGEERPIRCVMGTIPTGIFKSHVVGVCFP